MSEHLITTISSFVGILVILGIAVLISYRRQAIRMRSVGVAFGAQLTIALLAFYSDFGQSLFATLSSGIQSILTYGNVGIEFVFGDLAKFKLGFIVAVNVLPVIIFFSSLMAVLYHLGIMPLIIRVIGGGLSRFIGTSRTESIAAAANIFVGLTEAPLVVRPYINRFTQSELFAVMVCGLASTAGSMLAGYAALGIRVDYLIAASFMAAPAGLLMAKIIYPELEKPFADEDKNLTFDEEDATHNVIDAAASGASSGLQLAANVAAMLIAFVALVALLNGFLGFVGSFLGMEGLSLQFILGQLLSPIAFLLGVPWHEASSIGSLLGEKVILNEFVAFISLTGMQSDISEHSQIIATFALCGFANIGSLAILLGGLGGIAPQRRKDIARMGVRAVCAGMLANLMSAAMVGFFLSLSSI